MGISVLKKIQTLINQQRRTLADVKYLDLNSVTKIIQDFENPKYLGDKVSEEDTKFRISPEEYDERKSGSVSGKFNNYKRKGNRSILTELSTKDGNFLITIEIGRDGDIDFNIVSSVFGKNNMSLEDWLRSGYATYIDEQKVKDFLLHQSAPIAAASAKSSPYSAAKIDEKNNLNKLLGEKLYIRTKKFKKWFGDGTGKNRFYLHEVALQKNLQEESIKTDTKADSHQGDIAKLIKEIVTAKENSEKFSDKGTKFRITPEEYDERKRVEEEGEVRFSVADNANKGKKRKETNRVIDAATSFVTGKDMKTVRNERRERERNRKLETKEIYEKVLSGHFDDVTLQQINDYINDVTPFNPYGRRLSERLPQEVERAMYAGARENAIDALFSRIYESSVRPNERTRPSGRRAIEEGKQQKE